ncbi:tetratricopeptide repeat protein [Peijinzhouia sedimentorum]
MKKLITYLFVCFISFSAFAQNSNVNKAERSLKEGDLATAKEAIDEAQANEKTKDAARTLYTMAQVYQAIATSDDAQYASMKSDAFDKALEGFKKIIASENENSTYYILATEGLNSFWGAHFNKAAELFNEGEYEESSSYFKKAALIQPNDTTTLLFGGFAAQQSDDNDLALKNFNKLVEMDYEDLDVYRSLIYMQRVHLEDNEKALITVKKAKEAFPNDIDLAREEINILVELDRLDEALGSLEAAVKNDPTNELYFYNIGIIYDNQEEFDKAEANYKKVIELKPDHFEANFNLAAIYYNRAVEILGEANAMDLDEYQAKGKEVEAKAKVEFERALPYLEKAHQITADDISAAQTLQTVYAQLGMTEKSEAMAAKIAAMGGGN